MAISPERWQHIKTVFNESLDVEASRRSAFVSERAAGDRELEREVTSLLQALDQEADLFERPVLESLGGTDDFDQAPAATLVGRRVGVYDVVREIGHGGMGVVYEGVRADDQFRMRVAIKTIWRGSASAAILARFKQERQILAGLSHPNIAALLDGGVTDGGQPYLVMEYVDGAPIDAWATQRRLSIPQRIELFRQVCAAVQHAHRSLVVHRDLKPGNIMVTPDAVVKLLDFGIAKLLSDDGATTAEGLTRAGLNPLTTAYASPEQVRGDTITTASDVYSLGVVLYQLLTGRTPFTPAELSPLELQRHISDEPPPRPSGAVTAGGAAATAEGSAPKLARLLEGELDDIVLMALRKEPDRRYASVEQFSQDLARYLDHLPVIARPDTPAYRARKFVRRYRTTVGASAVAVVALVAGAAGVVVQARRAARERDRALSEAATAQRERENAEQVSRFLQGVVGAANPSWDAPTQRIGGDSASNAVLDAVARRVRSELGSLPEVRATVLRTLGKANMARARYTLAESQLDTALALHTRQPGDVGFREAAIDLSVLGALHTQAGRLQQADSVFRRSLALLRLVGDSTSIDFARASNDWGLVAIAEGRIRDAAPLIDATLRALRGLGRDSTGEYAIAMGNAALVADNLGKIDDAEQLYRGSLTAFSRVTDRDFFERGYSLHNLALVLSLKGRHDEALTLMKSADSLWKQFLGANHPTVAVSQIGIARVLHAAGRDAQAMPYLRRAGAILERRVPASHPDMARLDAVYGQVLLGLRQTDAAERRLAHAIAIRRATLKPRDWRLGDVIGSMGLVQLTRRRYDEAEALLRDSYAMVNDEFGPSHPRSVSAARNLATLYQAWGKPTTADSIRTALSTATRR